MCVCSTVQLSQSPSLFLSLLEPCPVLSNVHCHHFSSFRGRAERDVVCFHPGTTLYLVVSVVLCLHSALPPLHRLHQGPDDCTKLKTLLLTALHDLRGLPSLHFTLIPIPDLLLGIHYFYDFIVVFTFIPLTYSSLTKCSVVVCNKAVSL